MRISRVGTLALLGGWLASGARDGAAGTKPGSCSQEILEGAVHAGEPFVRPIGSGLEVMLEPLASGWILRVLPVSGPRGEHDYAELATPPYRSVSPLLISTDYSFRAQDAVAWNPRRFRYAASAAEFAPLIRLYREYVRTLPPATAEIKLARLVSQSPEGSIEVLDAHLVPGMANQAQMASVVASHLDATPHTIEQAAGGKGDALGRITWLKFRIRLNLPEHFRPSPGAVLKPQSCSIP